jgi:hypothetical protein
MNNQAYELYPSSSKQFKPAFTSQAEQERFMQELLEAVRPDLDKYRIARIRSEEAAMHNWIH